MNLRAWTCTASVVFAMGACVGDSDPIGNDAGPDVTTNDSGGSDAAKDVAQDVTATCDTDAGQSACGSSCVNLSTDSKNCGSCGATCAGAFTCAAGKCGNAVVEIARGSAHVCILTHDGNVYCRGESGYMQLATTAALDTASPYDSNAKIHASFVKVSLSGPASHVYAGGEATCVIMQANGTLDCWGDNRGGQLGHATSGDKACPSASGYPNCSDVPTQVALPDPVAQVSMGLANTCVVTTKGDVYCWGGGQDGQLGTGNVETTSFTPVKAAISNVVEVNVSYARPGYGAQNYGHTCALTKSNTVMCWGENINNELGHAKGAGSPVDSSCCINGDYWNNTPQLAAGLTSVTPKHIAAGFGYTCVLDVNGVVLCWGDNAFGIIKQPAGGNVASPTSVLGIPALTSINAMSTHFCGGTAGGDTWCWGETSFGEIGGGLTIGAPGAAVSCDNFNHVCIGPTKLTGIAVTDVRLGGGDPSAIPAFAEGGGTLALTPDGGVIAWGQDDYSMIQEADGGGVCTDGGALHCVPTPQFVTGLP